MSNGHRIFFTSLQNRNSRDFDYSSLRDSIGTFFTLMDSSFRTLCTLKYKYICSTIYYNIKYILYLLLTPTLKYNWPKLLLISGLSLYASAWIFSSRSQTRKYSCYGTRCCQNCRFRIGSRNSFFATLYRLCFYKMVSFVHTQIPNFFCLKT